MAGYNPKIRSAKIESFLDPEFLEIDNTFWPTKEDFTRLWESMSDDQKYVTAACVHNKSFGEVLDATAKSPAFLSNMFKKQQVVGKAIITARMCQLSSDSSKALFLEAFIGTHQARKYYFDEVQKIIKTDRDHLRELADKLTLDGDGKRGVLKEIVAYGMQTKALEGAIICPDTGVELQPMVVGLADARMAYNAIQELNRMDHEYGNDDKATSSIESQAERIKRLRNAMQRDADSQARTVNAVAKRVATRELKMIDDDSARGDV